MSLPHQIGRYRVLSLVGRGAMGVVYRGRDETLDRDVALKVMALGHVADADARARFQREARAVARLQHPNIVNIYELGEYEGAPYMAMELLEGLDLQRAIEGGLRPDPTATLPIVLQLLAGLGHAHDNGIVHRDVKPSNVFLPRGRPAKIMDFGVARLAGAATSTGAVVGTPNYMSPEQVRAGAIDGRSDLFSAGLILYELVTGEKAYRADSVVALLFKIVHDDPDLSLIPRGPEWERLRGVLARSVMKDPEARYPDAPAMAADLSFALADLGGSTDWAAASDLGLLVRTPRPSPTPVFDAPLATPEAHAAEPAADPPWAAEIAPPAVNPSVSLAPPADRTPLAHRRSVVLIASLLVVGAVGLLLVAVALLRPHPATIPVKAPTSTPGTPGAAPEPPTMTAKASPVSATPGTLKPPLAASPKPVRPTPAPEAPPVESPPTPEAPAPADARLERANALFEKGRYGAALAEARAVLRREPGNAEAKELVEDSEVEIVVDARVREAQAALRKGNKEAALEAAKAGLAVKPTDARLIALFREATQ